MHSITATSRSVATNLSTFKLDQIVPIVLLLPVDKMEVEEVDMTLELSVAPEEMAEFDSDGDAEDAEVAPPSNMGRSIMASSNGLSHHSTGGAGHIRVRMDTGAKFGK